MLRVAVAVLVATAALFGGLMLGEGVVATPPWDGPANALYRACWIAVLPARPVALWLAPKVAHQYPVSHFLISAAVASAGYALLWLGGLRAWRALNPRCRLLPGRPRAGQPSRRAFLAHAGAATSAAAMFSAGAGFSLASTGNVQVRRYDITVRGLPPALDGLRSVHITDTHFGPFICESYLRRVVELANDEGPDLVLLTGDYVHFTSEAIPRGIGLFQSLRPRLATVAVLGNHDHWEGARACRERFAAVRIPLLDNRRLFVTPSGLGETPSPGALCLAGLGDLWEDDVDYRAALDGVPDDMPRLLLSHNPDASEDAPAGLRVDLMLSGHTHGGQIILPGRGPLAVPSRFGTRFLGGVCEGKRFPVLVSRGIGVAAVPFRLGVPPEFSVLRLVRG
jgi:hypothetical protein